LVSDIDIWRTASEMIKGYGDELQKVRPGETAQ
jgi:hypothetical protein